MAVDFQSAAFTDFKFGQNRQPQVRADTGCNQAEVIIKPGSVGKDGLCLVKGGNLPLQVQPNSPSA